MRNKLSSYDANRYATSYAQQRRTQELQSPNVLAMLGSLSQLTATSWAVKLVAGHCHALVVERRQLNAIYEGPATLVEVVEDWGAAG